LVCRGAKRDGLVAKEIGGGIGRGSSIICIWMEEVGSSSTGGVGGSKCPGRAEVVPIAFSSGEAIIDDSA